MSKAQKKQNPSFLARLEVIDWAWLILSAVLIVVMMCMIIAVANKSGKPTADTASETETSDIVERNPQEYEGEPPMVVAEIPPRAHIGKCRMTVYTPTETHWGYTTATGATSAHLMTCAVDPKVIPYGSNVIVIGKDGTEYRYKAIDCGNFKGKWVDIFFDGSIRHGIEWLDENLGEWADVWIEEEQK